MPTDTTASKRVAALLVVLALLAYANTLRTGFTFDDQPDICENPVVTEGVDVVRILASPLPPGDLYRPFTVLTFAVNQWLTPGQPAPFHAINVLLHAGVTLLVFYLAMRLFGSLQVAAIAGVLFALHPIHTEAVTNLVGRAELLAACFGLSALLLAVSADSANGRARQVLLQSAALASFSLALLSKESALTVLPLMVLLRITLRRQPLGAGLWCEFRSLDWVPYVLCAAVFLALRIWVVGSLSASSVTPLDNVLAFVPAAVRLRSAFGVLWDYFGLLLVPIVLTADYSYAQVPVIDSWLNGRCIAGVALVLAAVVVLLRNRRPPVTFALIFPFVALSLTANLLFPIGTVKGERLLYLPSVGWALAVAYAFDRWLQQPRYRRLATAGLVAVVAIFGARTWTRNWDWTDNPTLYHSMVRGAPNSAKSRYNFAVALQQEEADEAAVAQFRRALEIYPWGGGAGSALGIGILFEKRGNGDKAVEWYRKALEIEPGFDKAHTNLCRVLLLDRRYESAIAACRNGLRFAPRDANLLKGLGESLVGEGDMEKGIAVLRRSLALNQEDQDLRTRVGQLEMAAAEHRDDATKVQ